MSLNVLQIFSHRNLVYLLRKQYIGLSGQYRYFRARPDQEKSQHAMILTKDVIYFYQNNNKDIQRKKAATKYRYQKNRGRKVGHCSYLISYLSSDELNSQSVAPISSGDFRFNGVHSSPNI